MTSTYTVTGMTCGHCVAAVSAEVGAVPGVTSAAVDLESGTLTVTSTGPVGRPEIEAAVTEAGYTLS
jgi:copper chaperone CopZ